MYDFYPRNETYTGNPQHVAPFCIRASLAEANRWGIELDDVDYRDMRDTMVADRAVVPQSEATTRAKPEEEHAC